MSTLDTYLTYCSTQPFACYLTYCSIWNIENWHVESSDIPVRRTVSIAWYIVTGIIWSNSLKQYSSVSSKFQKYNDIINWKIVAGRNKRQKVANDVMLVVTKDSHVHMTNRIIFSLTPLGLLQLDWRELNYLLFKFK